MIEFNERLAFFFGAKLTEKIGITKLNDILLNSIPDSWSNKVYVHIFDFEYTGFKRDVNMFECMEISESIYKGSVEHYYKNTTIADLN